MIQTKINIPYWDELASIHSEVGDSSAVSFLKGKSTLHSIEDQYFKLHKGLDVLHLQCHTGLDTLSIAEYHDCNVVGVDYSSKAIDVAKELSKNCQVPAEFICSDIYDLNLGPLTNRQFDVIYTSYGVLMWLNNLDSWAQLIYQFLRPGGDLLLIEEHPFAAMLKTDQDNNFALGYPYSSHQSHYVTNNLTSYSGLGKRLENTEQYKWAHSFEEIISSLLKNDLEIVKLKEYKYCFYKIFTQMEQNVDKWWHLNDNEHGLPLMFSLRAKKKERYNLSIPSKNVII